MARGRFGHGFSKEKTHEFLEWISHMTWTLKSDLCEVKMTERPSLMISRIRFHRKRRAWGSIPVVGSSWRDAWQPVSSRTKFFYQSLGSFSRVGVCAVFETKAGPCIRSWCITGPHPPPAFCPVSLTDCRYQLLLMDRHTDTEMKRLVQWQNTKPTCKL